MSSVNRRVLEDLQNGINSAKNTQTAIRFVATHFDKTIDKIELMEKEKNEAREKEEQALDFNPDEIETLVYREKNKFKEGLSAKVSGKIEEKVNSKKTSIEREDR